MVMATALDNADNAHALVISQHAEFKHALEPTSLDSAYRVATLAAKIGIGGVRSPEEALIRIMHGRTLGITAMQALRFVYVVNGRPSVDSTLMRALCLSHPDCEEFAPLKTTPVMATFRAKRRGHEPVTLTWTLEDARRARLAEKESWRMYPAQMLRARVTADLARLVFPDAVAGLPLREDFEPPSVTSWQPEQRPESESCARVEDGVRDPVCDAEADETEAEAPVQPAQDSVSDERAPRRADRPRNLAEIWQEQMEAAYREAAAVEAAHERRAAEEAVQS